MDQTPFAILNGHGGFVFALAFSPDSQRIASAGLDATARLWDISTGENLLTLGQSAPLYTLAFQPDGDRLLAGDMHGNTLVWDLTPSGSAERLAWTGHSAMIRAASLGMDGSRLATASLDGTVRIWNLATGRELLLLDGHLGSPVMGVAFHPDGRRLATASTDGTARVWDGETGQELLRLEGHGEGSVGNGLFEGVMGLSYSPDGQRLATAGADGTARIWDSAMGDELLVLEGHTGGLTRVVYSSNGRYLASGGEDANVRIWSAETGQQLFAFSADHGEQLWGLDFSADGRFLATSGSDTMARVWSLDIEGREAELLATITGHVRTVTAVRFSPDGQVLATAAPGFVRLWDISGLHDNTGGSSLTELLALPGGPAVAFNEDGSELLVGDRQGLLRVYLLDPDELMALARERLTRWWTLEECQRFLHQEQCPEE
jgi:WD40 repeat protein